ncbi:hypothetical protein BC830DRAFT_665452 [Chytriomyces sp. MP71]|nr:hypothetical protein BC830DRAFT_665452 [Chytriomyces sp. MP71]
MTSSEIHNQIRGFQQKSLALTMVAFPPVTGTSSLSVLPVSCSLCMIRLNLIPYKIRNVTIWNCRSSMLQPMSNASRPSSGTLRRIKNTGDSESQGIIITGEHVTSSIKHIQARCASAPSNRPYCYINPSQYAAAGFSRAPSDPRRRTLSQTIQNDPITQNAPETTASVADPVVQFQMTMQTWFDANGWSRSQSHGKAHWKLDLTPPRSFPRSKSANTMRNSKPSNVMTRKLPFDVDAKAIFELTTKHLQDRGLLPQVLFLYRAEKITFFRNYSALSKKWN